MEIDDYFNKQGNFLYSTAEGNNIIIKDKGEIKKLTEYSYSTSNVGNREMLTNVATHYAKEAGFEQDVSITDVNRSDNPLATVNPKTGEPKIVVNKGGVNQEANFTGNMISSFVHEKSHVGDPFAGTPMGEIRAITSQVTDPSFMKEGSDPNATTSSYRQSIGRYAETKLNEGLSSSTQSIKISPYQANNAVNSLNSTPLTNSCILYFDNRVNRVSYILPLPSAIISGKKR
jgi:hypothetical protein